jgi:hypothetical protein
VAGDAAFIQSRAAALEEEASGLEAEVVAAYDSVLPAAQRELDAAHARLKDGCVWNQAGGGPSRVGKGRWRGRGGRVCPVLLSAALSRPSSALLPCI